jgi:hypothetical protein
MTAKVTAGTRPTFINHPPVAIPLYLYTLTVSPNRFFAKNNFLKKFLHICPNFFFCKAVISL